MAQRKKVTRTDRNNSSLRHDLSTLELPDLHPSLCPKSHHLIITTTKAVLAWTSAGTAKLFRSASGGIVAAKRAPDGSGILAVADSQVVVLHDIKKGMRRRSYKLRGSEGQVRLLRYANDSSNLFFTTSLSNSVHTYSSRESRILDPLHTHPSPPTVLVLSAPSHLLLSASANPPTTYLTNLLLNTSPILLQPLCSACAVVAAAFHPERSNVFILAFADGVLALYDAVRLLRDGGKGERRSGPAGTGRSGEVAHVHGEHASGVSVLSDSDEVLNPALFGVYDGGTKTATIGSRGDGITAIAFLPGYRSRIVSAGADGKCLVYDFELTNMTEGRPLKTWHVRAPVTSVSIVLLQGSGTSGQELGQATSTEESSSSATERASLIAVGRTDGKVCLFDDLGTMLGEKLVDPARGRVVDVEWMYGSGDKLPKTVTQSHREQVYSSTAQPSMQRSLSFILASGRQAKEEVLAVDEDNIVNRSGGDHRPAVEQRDTPEVPLRSPERSLKPTDRRDYTEPSTADCMNGLSQVRGVLPGHVSTVDPNPVHASHNLQNASKQSRGGSRGPMCPHPPARRGSLAAFRRARTPRKASQDDRKETVETRPAAVSKTPARDSVLAGSLMNPNMANDGNASAQVSRSNTNNKGPLRVPMDNPVLEDLWMDVPESPEIPERTNSRRKLADTGRASHKKRTSHVRERSNETIIDWEQGQPQSIPHLVRKIFKAEERKFHATDTTTSDDTVVQWSWEEKSPRQSQVPKDPEQFQNSKHADRKPSQIRIISPSPKHLIETTGNQGRIQSTYGTIETTKAADEVTGPQSATQGWLEEKLEEAKADLSAEVRNVQRFFQETLEDHKRQIEVILTTECLKIHKAVEESERLRNELLRTKRHDDE